MLFAGACSEREQAAPLPFVDAASPVADAALLSLGSDGVSVDIHGAGDMCQPIVTGSDRGPVRQAFHDPGMSGVELRRRMPSLAPSIHHRTDRDRCFLRLHVGRAHGREGRVVDRRRWTRRRRSLSTRSGRCPAGLNLQRTRRYDAGEMRDSRSAHHRGAVGDRSAGGSTSRSRWSWMSVCRGPSCSGMDSSRSDTSPCFRLVVPRCWLPCTRGPRGARSDR